METQPDASPTKLMPMEPCPDEFRSRPKGYAHTWTYDQPSVEVTKVSAIPEVISAYAHEALIT